MMASHPQAKPNGLVVGAVEHMPILGRVLPFAMANETTVCTIETKDRAGRTRGGICIGIANHDAPIGVATASSIDEAKVMLQLIQNAIDDAERIERGEAPLAQEGLPRRDN